MKIEDIQKATEALNDATESLDRIFNAQVKREWVGLTDEEMLSVVHYTQLDNARAIEAKLKEKNT
jgi:hypothetical protein